MQSDPSFHYVDGRWLLALYAVIPLSFAVIAFDALVLQRALLHNLLPDDPNDWALWALLFVPVMLSLALAMMNHFVSHRVLLPMSPLLVSYRCLVFDMPDPTGVGVYFPARIAYAIWGTSLAVHGAIAIASCLPSLTPQ